MVKHVCARSQPRGRPGIQSQEEVQRTVDRSKGVVEIHGARHQWGCPQLTYYVLPEAAWAPGRTNSHRAAMRVSLGPGYTH